LDSDALNELKSLAKHAKPMESLHNGKWMRLELQHIFQGFVSMFPGVNVYQATNGQVRNSTSYGNNVEGVVQVNVLHWNMMQHYDCLILKKGNKRVKLVVFHDI
jgi:hypothetical protein